MVSRVLVTGAAGMLGATLVKEWSNHYQVFATDQANFGGNSVSRFKEFNLLNPSYTELLEWAKPDVVVHCAAITNVDYCEENPNKALKVNAESVKKFLQPDKDIRLIFISSDAVFSDNLNLATETDILKPQNIYGKSKELGEKYINNAGLSNISIRTTIVGKNINPSSQGFLEWLINSVKNGVEIHLFEDVLFTPITTWHLGKELEWIMQNDLSGVLHIAGSQPISKYNFGYQICKGLGLEAGLIKPCSLNDFSFKAKRSKDQTLDSSFYESLCGHLLPDSEETVESIIKHFKEPANF